MIFRKANIDDLDSVLNIYESVKKDKYCVWNDLYPLKEDAVNDIENNNLFLLEVNDEVVGTISIVSENELNNLKCWSSNKDCVEIARVSIEKDKHNRGYSKYLVSYILDELTRRGYKWVHLSVAKINEPAKRLYSSLKFNIVGENSMFNNEYYLMEKKI